jgi:hypothetical protein
MISADSIVFREFFCYGLSQEMKGLEGGFIAHIHLNRSLAETDSSKSMINISHPEADILISENFVDFKGLKSLPQTLHCSLCLDIK